MTWEMLSGRVAFPAPTEYARLAAVLHANPEPLEKVDAALAPIAPIIARAMEKDPARRWGSALEMARALAAAAASTPPPPNAPEPSRLNVTPLSRLPAVPSLFGPPSGISPGASSERHTPVAPELDLGDKGRTPSGTLPSAAGGGPNALNTPAPQVRVVEAPQGATMPSHDLPVLEAVEEGKPRIARGVSAGLVVVLVLAALAAGFVLGFVVGRSL
jgi:serine/threonine-protein kinase